MQVATERQVEEVLQTLDEDLAQHRSHYADYQALHRNRFKNDIKLIEKYYKGGQILEVGATPCCLTFVLQRLGFPTKGLDIKPDDYLDFIQRHQLDVATCDVERERFPFPDEHFSLVLCNEVLEHLRYDPIRVMYEIGRVLRPDGFLILTTPNLFSLKNLWFLARGRGLATTPYKAFKQFHDQGYTGHVREYSLHELRDFVQNCGLQVVNSFHMNHDPSRGNLTSPLVNLTRRLLPGIQPYIAVVAKK